MQHFTCDVCGKPMTPGDDRRYVVKMDVFAAHDPAELTEADLDTDNMEEVSQMLSEDGDGRMCCAGPRVQAVPLRLVSRLPHKTLRDPLNREPRRISTSAKTNSPPIHPHR